MDDSSRRVASAGTTTPWRRAVAKLATIYFGCLAGFFLLLAALPLYETEPGSARTPAPGLATGVLMITSMAVGLLTPFLGSRLGYRPLLLGGLLLMGATALLLPLTPDPATLVIISALRGAGFAAVVVGVGSVAAWGLPPGRRGEGMSVLGIVSTITALAGLPAGVWLGRTIGFGPVFVIAAGLPLLAVVPTLLVSLPDRTALSWRLTDRATARTLWRSAVILATSALLSGIMITHLPVVVGDLAAVLLLLHAAALAGGRWLAARWCDRHGRPPGWWSASACLLGAVAVVLTAGGLSRPLLIMVAAAALGLGFGVIQSVVLAAMLDRLPPTTVGAANAVWNASYDIGWALGAAAVGAVIASVGYDGGTVLGAAVAVGAAGLALRGARRVRPVPAGASATERSLG